MWHTAYSTRADFWGVGWHWSAPVSIWSAPVRIWSAPVSIGAGKSPVTPSWRAKIDMWHTAYSTRAHFWELHTRQHRCGYTFVSIREGIYSSALVREHTCQHWGRYTLVSMDAGKSPVTPSWPAQTHTNTHTHTQKQKHTKSTKLG